MTSPDILLFLSDQHNGLVMGCAGDPVVETPQLDALAKEGTMFSRAYTPCPLCVPARVAFLTGHLPSKNVAFTNGSAIPEDHATWLHGLVAAGYETVLCGRMHFVGEDQRHGFTDRIFPDITPQFWQSGGKFNEALGDYSGTLDASAATLRAIGGGGVSPVLAYDRAVIDAALSFLRSRKGTRPLCLVVGTYGPHNPYVCSEELYEKYWPRTVLPHQFGEPSDCDNALVRERRVEMTAGQARSLRAAYYGMVETLDAQVGEVRAAWNQFLRERNREGMFVYTSDHGEHAGERNILAKQTLFEPAVRIPLIMAGEGIQAGKRRDDLASLLDIGPTFCARAKAPLPPSQDGVDLFETCRDDRAVVSELMAHLAGRPVLCRMVRRGRWKLVIHSDPAFADLLFDLETDPHEQINCASGQAGEVTSLKAIAMSGPDMAEVVQRHHEKYLHSVVLVAAGDAIGPPETEVWTACRGRYLLPTLDYSHTPS